MAIAWFVVRLDLAGVVRQPPAPWVGFPITPENRHGLRARVGAAPSKRLAAIIADFYVARGKSELAERARLLGTAASIEWHWAPTDLIFIEIFEDAGWHPARDLKLGMMLRLDTHLPEIQFARPVVHAAVWCDRGGTVSLCVSGGGHFFETLAFPLRLIDG